MVLEGVALDTEEEGFTDYEKILHDKIKILICDKNYYFIF